MKKICIAVAAVLSLLVIAYLINKTPVVTVDKSDSFADCSKELEMGLVRKLNSDKTAISVAGTGVNDLGFDFYVSDDMKLMVEADFLKRILSCSVVRYSDGSIILMKGDTTINLAVGSNEASVNKYTNVNLVSVPCDKGAKTFIPFDSIAEYLNYSVDYHLQDNWIDIAKTGEENKLPEAYDMRDYGRVSAVRDQGRYGTCWAFASLGALETTLLPEQKNTFSTDHMSLCNSYNLDLNRGGEHTMSIAYLAAWQGPVYEKDDPYGDEETNPDLKSVKHLEEALVINDKDMETIKSAIFRYGAIETSLYSQMEYADSKSVYYSEEDYTYYYNGEEEPNHDIVVVGWDDNFPKEKFTIEPEHDGAFVCKNSWGESFGDEGFFYVSYDDVNICQKSVAYTKVGEEDNYDKIYQSDLLGWVGQMGFRKEEAYIANVYTAGTAEELAAVSFYATDKDTEFDVYVVSDFNGTEDFANKEFKVSGSMKYAGYYTVDLPEPVKLTDNKKFAVIVRIKTPNAVRPIAIEYNADERTENFDISDGEGYISLYGEMWHSAEKTENCNICLKAFTNKIK